MANKKIEKTTTSLTLTKGAKQKVAVTIKRPDSVAQLERPTVNTKRISKKSTMPDDSWAHNTD